MVSRMPAEKLARLMFRSYTQHSEMLTSVTFVTFFL